MHDVLAKSPNTTDDITPSGKAANNIAAAAAAATTTTNPELTNKNTQYIGLSTAGARAIVYQATTLYLRTPMKLFRPQRVDYMALTRLYVHGSLQGRPPAQYNFFHDSSIATLITAVRRYGWKFIPERILPPLIANSATGMVLYTTYLSTLQILNSSKSTNFLENPSAADTFRAGFIAGVVQSLTAAPIDAIYARSSANEILSGKYTNLWTFAAKKLHEIGLQGVFAGYGFSVVKESLGFGFYFCIFETVKNQWFYNARDAYVSMRYYHSCLFNWNKETKEEYYANFVDTHRFRILKTSFMFTAGILASLTLQIIQYPLSKLQRIHYSRLEALDVFNHRDTKSSHHAKVFNLYYNTYMNTFDYIAYLRSKSNLTWREWSYKGFKRHALGTIPATTLALLTLEVLRGYLASEVESQGAEFGHI
ncbi:hypothetical protein WICPIJ_005217 [Wickerhamomyces pijperi]|uniref:Mitochondrial carrier protein n=1 Tax=Wickerhamomyces pijperi TaxID=599730 RepID=A0A9P8Q4D9_WICPI|nr:hypothetical protein WICPIJ_005217 [Wickerhamomyces pijperi]